MASQAASGISELMKRIQELKIELVAKATPGRQLGLGVATEPAAVQQPTAPAEAINQRPTQSTGQPQRFGQQCSETRTCGLCGQVGHL